jgi:septum site-determining protein MinC
MVAVSSAGEGAERDVPFQLRGNSFTMMVLKVIAPESPGFFSALASKVRQAPNFFRHAPVVLDLEEMAPPEPGFDLARFVEQVREHHLLPLGFCGGPAEIQSRAVAMGLVPMPAGRAGRMVEPGRVDSPPPPAPEPAFRPALMVREPVRSGQQVYAEKTDLIITSSVSHGAEVLADGNIHVYGALRGRALAGISGDAGARIFCQSLEAELVSIAGLYQVCEDIDKSKLKKPVQIGLKEGYLVIEAL